jgi:hypothetical protein
MSDDFDTLEEAPHSVFAPSASDGWMTCADYINANKGKPDTAGIDAATGTRFHQLMEHALRNRGSFRPQQWLGKEEIIQAGGKDFCIKVDQEMVDCAVDCLRWVAGLEGETYVETRVDFSDLTPIPRQRGTCDLAVCQPRMLFIRDWKYGKGYWISPVRLRQLMIYAYGFFREWDWLYDFQTIEIGIGQPRLDNFQTWTLTRAELLDFAEEVRVAAHLAIKPNQPRTPSEKGCRWCKDVTCSAKKAFLDSLVDTVFDDLDAPEAESFSTRQMVVAATAALPSRPSAPPDPRQLSTARLSYIYRHRKMFETWFNAIGAELVARAQSGDIADDMKLVVSRTRSAISDSEKYAAILRSAGVPENEFTVKKFVSPAKAVNLMRKYNKKMTRKIATDMLQAAVLKPPGKHALVHKSDSREAVKGLAEDSFSDLDASDL